MALVERSKFGLNELLGPATWTARAHCCGHRQTDCRYRTASRRHFPDRDPRRQNFRRGYHHRCRSRQICNHHHHFL